MKALICHLTFYMQLYARLKPQVSYKSANIQEKEMPQDVFNFDELQFLNYFFSESRFCVMSNNS